MKICTKCNESKDKSAFYRQGDRSDGLRSHCKVCVNRANSRYRQSDRGKKVAQEYGRSDAGKAAHKRSSARYYRAGGKEVCRKYSQKYSKTPAGRASQRRRAVAYRQTDAGKEAHRHAAALYRMRHPERVKATKVIYSAVQAGKLPHISTQACAHCPAQAEQYHHPDYSKPLEVTPLCIKCHTAVHR